MEHQCLFDIVYLCSSRPSHVEQIEHCLYSSSVSCWWNALWPMDWKANLTGWSNHPTHAKLCVTDALKGNRCSAHARSSCKSHARHNTLCSAISPSCGHWMNYRLWWANIHPSIPAHRAEVEGLQHISWLSLGKGQVKPRASRQWFCVWWRRI